MIDLNKIALNGLGTLDFFSNNLVAGESSDDEILANGIEKPQDKEPDLNCPDSLLTVDPNDPNAFILLLTHIVTNTNNHPQTKQDLTQTIEVSQSTVSETNSEINGAVVLEPENVGDQKNECPIEELEDNVAIAWINSEYYKSKIETNKLDTEEDKPYKPVEEKSISTISKKSNEPMVDLLNKIQDVNGIENRKEIHRNGESTVSNVLSKDESQPPLESASIEIKVIKEPEEVDAKDIIEATNELPKTKPITPLNSNILQEEIIGELLPTSQSNSEKATPFISQSHIMNTELNFLDQQPLLDAMNIPVQPTTSEPLELVFSRPQLFDSDHPNRADKKEAIAINNISEVTSIGDDSAKGEQSAQVNSLTNQGIVDLQLHTEHYDSAIIIQPQNIENHEQALFISPQDGNPIDTSIPTEIDNSEWTRQFSERVIWLGQQGIKRAVIKLNPEDLGPLEISIKVVKDSASINITSHNDYVRNMIDQSLPILQTMMAEKGIDLSEVHVDSDTSSHQFTRHDNESQEEQMSGKEEEELIAPLKNKNVIKGVVDYFA